MRSFFLFSTIALSSIVGLGGWPFRRPSPAPRPRPSPPEQPIVPVEELPLELFNTCEENLPSSLSFIEPLVEGIEPRHITIITGGDSLQRRSSGFAKISADSLKALAAYHGYNIVFLDELDYEKSLKYKGVQYHPMWHRIFALDAIRAKFPESKYFVNMDDDILCPYPETDMLHHYVNLMEAEPDWEMTYGEEAPQFTMNAGFFFFKNNDFAFEAYRAVLEIGLEDKGRLAMNFGHEQEAMVIYRARKNLQDRIRVIPHREGPYNFNTFARDLSIDPPGSKQEYGDAFVHFLGQRPEERFNKMGAVLREVQNWRRRVPKHCKYPLNKTLNTNTC